MEKTVARGVVLLITHSLNVQLLVTVTIPPVANVQLLNVTGLLNDVPLDNAIVQILNTALDMADELLTEIVQLVNVQFVSEVLPEIVIEQLMKVTPVHDVMVPKSLITQLVKIPFEIVIVAVSNMTVKLEKLVLIMFVVVPVLSCPTNEN